MPTTRQQLFRRYEVAQMFRVCTRTVKNYQARGWLTPLRARPAAKRRRIRCIRKGKPAVILTRGPLVLYHRTHLRALAKRLAIDVPEIGASYSPFVALPPQPTPFSSRLRASAPPPETESAPSVKSVSRL